jgi:hypothetical protein
MKSRDRKRMAAMLMIGQGALAALKPKRWGRLGRSERKAYRNLMRKLDDNRPMLMSALGLVGAGLGAFWVLRRFKR